MLFEKLKEEVNFTNHEKEVAHYILEHAADWTASCQKSHCL